MLRRLAPLALALLALTGCGSSGARTVTVATSAPSATTATAVTDVTKAQFIARADPICRAGNMKLDAIAARVDSVLKGASGTKAGTAMFRQAVALTRTYVVQLQTLPEPPADKPTLSKWLAALGESATDLKKVADAVASEDTAAERAALEAGQKAKALSHGIAQGYGFKVCGAHE